MRYTFAEVTLYISNPPLFTQGSRPEQVCSLRSRCATHAHTVTLHAGFALSTGVLATLTLRYMRKDGTLRFGDFVSAVLHLGAAFGESPRSSALELL